MTGVLIRRREQSPLPTLFPPLPPPLCKQKRHVKIQGAGSCLQVQEERPHQCERWNKMGSLILRGFQWSWEDIKVPDACPHSVGLQTFELGQVANIPTTLQEYLQLAPVNRHLPSDRLSNQILCSQGKLSAPTPIKIFCKQLMQAFPFVCKNTLTVTP